ncbi:hypothetical protein Tco_1448217 [Tanacetum coccineum]
MSDGSYTCPAVRNPEKPSYTRITSSRSSASTDSTAPLTLITHLLRSYYETPSPSSSPTLPIQKRHWGTSELVEDTKDESSDSDAEREGADDEGHG